MYLRRTSGFCPTEPRIDRKSTRLNSSHLGISYAVFCLKKKNKMDLMVRWNAPTRGSGTAVATGRVKAAAVELGRPVSVSREHGLDFFVFLFFFKESGPPKTSPFSPPRPFPN